MNKNSADPGNTEDRRTTAWWSVAVSSILLGLSIAGILTAAMFGIGDYYHGDQESQRVVGRRQLRELQDAQQQELQTYGWISQPDGVVRIPIERAMQLLVEQGREESPTGTPSSGAGTPAGSSP